MLKKGVLVFSWLFIISIPLNSCKLFNIKNNATKIAVIDFEDNLSNFQNLKLSDVGGAIKYIELETLPNNPIQYINHIAIYDSIIVIISRSRVFLFNGDGNFTQELGKVGNGPFDHHLAVSPRVYKNKIQYGDGRGSKNSILSFSLEGNYVGRTLFPFQFLSGNPWINSWYPSSDTTFLTLRPNRNGDEAFRIIEIDNKGKFLRGFKNTSKYHLNTSSGSPKSHLGGSTLSSDGHFYSYYDTICFAQGTNDTIWHVDGENLTPRFIIKRGKYGITNQMLGLSIENKELSTMLKETIFIRHIFETHSHIMFRSRFGKHYPFSFRRSAISGPAGPIEPKHEILGIFNKQTQDFFFVAPSGEDYQLEPLGIENDIDGGINFAPMYSPNERTLVSWFNAMDLKAHVESDGFKNSKPKYPERKRELEALANRLKYDDNPVLMVVTLGEEK